MIELRQFRQFIAVAEELNFRKAAERLHMAQPPLTAAVRKIEEELGVVLIERTNRVERLTSAGLVFLEEARRVLAQADRAIRAAARAGRGLTGSLRVAFVASAAHDLLPRILREYRKDHGEIALTLEEATTAQQIAALRENRTDIGIVVLPVVDGAGLSVELIRRGTLAAALPDGHSLAEAPALSLADLADEPWILFPGRYGPGLHGRIMTACAAAGFAPQIVQEAVQMETIVSLVAGGIGVALVPSSLAARGRCGVAFRTLKGPGTPIIYELALAYGRRSAALDAFVAAARSVAHLDP